MTEHDQKHLEEQLAGLTSWQGGPRELWRRALDAAKGGERSPWFSLRVLLTPPIVVAAVLLIAVGVTGAILLPNVQRARAIVSLQDSNLRSLGPASPISREDLEPDLAGGGGGGGYVVKARPSFPFQIDGDAERSTLFLPRSRDPALPADRQVVRKATIELVTDDVRAVFLKAGQLLSQAKGEYVEASSLTGTGKDARASLTLRVDAERLHEVLNGLRELGTVGREESLGEDVTAQVVDIDARLRNERRVEAELLGLLEKRDDAPLGDILRLREKINEVRMSIERLVARQQGLQRLVSLARVLVIIRPEDAPKVEPKAEPGLGQYFGDRIDASWGGGLRFLADTVARLLQVLVGGLVWWLVLIVAFVAVRNYRRRLQNVTG